MKKYSALYIQIFLIFILSTCENSFNDKENCPLAGTTFYLATGLSNGGMNGSTSQELDPYINISFSTDTATLTGFIWGAVSGNF